MPNHHLRLKNDLAEIQRLEESLAAFGSANGLPRETLLDLHLIFEEILTNIIKYGYDDDHEHFIDIDMVAGNDAMLFEIVDDGRPFNPLEKPAPDLDTPLMERPIGGLGLHLVRHLTDAIHYVAKGGKNILRFTKKHARRDR